MTDNGVSLPTALSQVDNMAKVQLKAQQTHHPTGPLAEQLDQSRATKVERVQKPDQAEKGRIQPEERRERRREARDRRPSGEEPPGADPAAAAEDGSEAAAGAADGLGGLDALDGLGRHVDTKV